MQRYLDILDIINDVKKSIENKNYLSALSLALTIPDKCGQIEYGTDVGVGQRYIDWYNTWCHDYNNYQEMLELPDADGKFIYQLRCSFLHAHSTDLDYDKLEQKNKLDEFELEIGDYMDGVFAVYASGVINDGESRHMRLRLIDLCLLICHGAQKYYEKNKQKVNEASKIIISDYRDILRKNRLN